MTVKCIFLKERCCILIPTSLKFVTKGPIDKSSLLVQVMAWCQYCTKPLFEPVTTHSVSHKCVPRPQSESNVLKRWESFRWVKVYPHRRQQHAKLLFLKSCLVMIWCSKGPVVQQASSFWYFEPCKCLMKHAIMCHSWPAISLMLPASGRLQPISASLSYAYNLSVYKPSTDAWEAAVWGLVWPQNDTTLQTNKTMVFLVHNIYTYCQLIVVQWHHMAS